MTLDPDPASLARHHAEVTADAIARGIAHGPVLIPEYRTLTPILRQQTSVIGALDGSDQQMFALISDPDKGVGIWATTYCEFDPRDPSSSTYVDGPESGGLLAARELLSYHLTFALPNPEVNRSYFNDLYSVRQILSNTRPYLPPIFNPRVQPQGARSEAAKMRATGEWLALRSAIIQQSPPNALLLKDGRFNSQIEQASHWVDQTGRMARRNNVHAVAIVKSGNVYQRVFDTVGHIARQAERPFYFVVSPADILAAYDSEVHPIRKTLMVGGKDHTDLGGIGALWTVFCPDPVNWRSFAVVEFNVYDLHNYLQLAREPFTLRQWQAERFPERFHVFQDSHHVYVTDLVVDLDRDIGGLVEPVLSDILWLCEQEVQRFSYPNLLGKAHDDVVLTRDRVARIRRHFQAMWDDAATILDDLVANEFVENPHKTHNIS
jgi:hypothetical protein